MTTEHDHRYRVNRPAPRCPCSTCRTARRRWPTTRSGPAELAAWSADLPRPTSILVVSAHWESAPLTVGATEPVPLTYDFWGFPERYYQVTYDAPGAPELARDVHGLLSRPGQEVHQDPKRGLDHGAYVPLVEMFPEADIPVLQVSMPSLDPQVLFELGPQAGAAAGRRRADHRVRVHHPQPVAGAVRRHHRQRAGVGSGVRRLGQAGGGIR